MYRNNLDFKPNFSLIYVCKASFKNQDNFWLPLSAYGLSDYFLIIISKRANNSICNPFENVFIVHIVIKGEAMEYHPTNIFPGYDYGLL